MHNKENIKEYRDFGRVSFVKSSRARRLAIRISQMGEVRVSMPRYVGMRQAEAFLMSKKKWVLHKQKQLAELQSEGLDVSEGSIDVRGARIQLGSVNGNESLEEAIWKAILPTAKEYLDQRTRALAFQHGIHIEGIRIRRMRTRWGSCSARNTINLNSWLVLLPEHLSDYVILHELAHTRHRNHGPLFWQTLDEMTGGDSAMLRRELGSHRIMLVNSEKQFSGQGD